MNTKQMNLPVRLKFKPSFPPGPPCVTVWEPLLVLYVILTESIIAPILTTTLVILRMAFGLGHCPTSI